MKTMNMGATGTSLLLAAAVLSGCALGGGRDGSDDALPDPDLIARNLVNTLTQLPELHPLQTTVQVSAPATPFGRHVLARLDEAGYGIQEVSADQGVHYVRYRAERAETETGERTRYRVAIGPVAVERDYRVVAGETLPGSAQSVHGAEPHEDVRLNDDVFADVPSEALSTVRFGEGDEPRVVDLTVPTVSPVVLGAAAPAVPLESEGVGSFVPDGSSSDFRLLVRQNMYDMQRSNYAPLFAAYEDIRQDTLVFPNDSLVLGESNKEIIADYVRELDPATDVLSVIGCSHGRTAIDNGNELLAIGRANRVKEAFMFAGLAHDQVLEESCWADSYHAVFPRRGVVLTLKRRRDIG